MRMRVLAWPFVGARGLRGGWRALLFIALFIAGSEDPPRDVGAKEEQLFGALAESSRAGSEAPAWISLIF